MEANLFNWGFIKKVIDTHEAITGNKPTHVQVPAPPEFKIMGVNVTLISDKTYQHVTADHERCLYHSPVEHKNVPTNKLTPVK